MYPDPSFRADVKQCSRFCRYQLPARRSTRLPRRRATYQPSMQLALEPSSLSVHCGYSHVSLGACTGGKLLHSSRSLPHGRHPTLPFRVGGLCCHFRSLLQVTLILTPSSIGSQRRKHCEQASIAAYRVRAGQTVVSLGAKSAFSARCREDRRQKS